MRRRRKRIVDGIVGILLSATVLVVLVWNLFVPDQEISTKESRVLAQRPKLTLNSLVSGEFMEKYETYLADQFAGRDLWRNLKVTLGRLGGVRQENGVVWETAGSCSRRWSPRTRTLLRKHFPRLGRSRRNIPTWTFT